MNLDTFEGQWTRMRGEITSWWDELTETGAVSSLQETSVRDRAGNLTDLIRRHRGNVLRPHALMG
jgi:hypothetical protein